MKLKNLPWSLDKEDVVRDCNGNLVPPEPASDDDFFAFMQDIIHTCNLYPKLVEALREIQRGQLQMSTEESFETYSRQLAQEALKEAGEL